MCNECNTIEFVKCLNKMRDVLMRLDLSRLIFELYITSMDGIMV